MIASGIVQKLNTQMNLEFYASNLCLHLSLWCSEQKLMGAAVFLRLQAQNNVTHMMQIFDFMKSSGAYPVIQNAHPDTGQEYCSTLEGLFEKVLEEHLKLASTLTEFTEAAEALHEDNTVHFLSSIRAAQQQDGLLLETLLDEVHHARKAGLSMHQTDYHLLTMVNNQLH